MNPERPIDLETQNPEKESKANPNENWGRTVAGNERAKHDPSYEEPDGESIYGSFKGRKIIGRDSPINTGVYIGAGGREAIVVDDEKDEELNKTYEDLELIMKGVSESGGRYKGHVLKEVFNLTQQKLPYDLDTVNKIYAKYKVSPDDKIRLGIYIHEHGGVCRHQALLVAYLLERLASNGKVRGKVSIDRNTIKGMGGHAWVRYTNSEGKVFIIDPAQNYIDSLDNPKKKPTWNYNRPEEK